MSWYKSYSVDKPDEVDTTSSKDWVYIRKNFNFVEATADSDSYWEYDEKLISKEDREIFQSVQSHDDALDDVYSALTELAEIIVGE